MSDEIQVVLSAAIRYPFEEWLASRRLHLFRIPGLDDDDDLPTYAVGVNQDLWDEVNGRV